jgi:hypothetical protein
LLSSGTFQTEIRKHSDPRQPRRHGG